MVIDIQEDYYSRFVSLPKGAVKATETHKGSLSKEVLTRVGEYENGKSKTVPLCGRFWDEVDVF